MLTRVIVAGTGGPKKTKFQYTYACHSGEQAGGRILVVKNPMLEPAIHGSFASLEALTQIMADKFC